MTPLTKIIFAGLVICAGEAERVEQARYYQENKARIAATQRVYRKCNRPKIRATLRRWVDKNRERTRAYARKHYRANRVKCLAASASWARRNAKKCALAVMRHSMKPHIRCHLRVSKAIKSTFGRGRSFRKWEELLGYSSHDLKRHLESLFTEGMSWERFMRGEIHIDHRMPKVTFLFASENDPEFKRCWALSNLQPLWAIDNIKKGAKVLAGENAA